MKFEKKLKEYTSAELWDEYCGFLDMDLNSYMHIQSRLLEEQLSLFENSPLGKRIFAGNHPRNVKEFRSMIPLTTYKDYADMLIFKREEMLPLPPVVWLQTTWESGSHPVKLAPYTKEMLDVYQHNLLAGLLLCTSTQKGSFNIKPDAKVLYGLAPMPYATGLFPHLIESQIRLRFLPSVKEAQKLSFSQQSEVGFRLGMKKGIDLFFGMSSVLYCISKNFGTSKMTGGGKSALSLSPRMLWRSLSAKYKSKRDGHPIDIKDLFTINGFVCCGSDSALYKDDLERFWGLRPTEITGGTESTLLGTETWSKNGTVFFPDACFYEFITENDMLRSLSDPQYEPPTYLMDELVAGDKYELVITSLKGGAFARYRIGDVYRCLRLKNREDGIDFPQFEYVDRIPTIIDIAGFTRITQASIQHIIDLSGLRIAHWFAAKEYDEVNRSFMHLYAEVSPDALATSAVSRQIIHDHLSVYFRHYDHDYEDLKRLLGMDPLQVTILPCGTIARYKELYEHPIEKINPPKAHVLDLLRLQHEPSQKGGTFHVV